MNESFPVIHPALVALLPILIPLGIVLKGFSLWYAGRGGQKVWFIILLVVNTMGIVEIVYLLFFRPHAPYKKVFERVTKDAPPVE